MRSAFLLAAVRSAAFLAAAFALALATFAAFAFAAHARAVAHVLAAPFVVFAVDDDPSLFAVDLALFAFEGFRFGLG